MVNHVKGSAEVQQNQDGDQTGTFQIDYYLEGGGTADVKFFQDLFTEKVN